MKGKIKNIRHSRTWIGLEVLVKTEDYESLDPRFGVELKQIEEEVR